MLRQCLRTLALLFGLQAVLGGIVFLLADFRWLALPIGMAFLVLVWITGVSLGRGLDLPRPAALGISLILGLTWQIPGLQGTLRSFSDMRGWTAYDGVTDLQDFAMQTWHTVMLPVLASIPPGAVGGFYARYYIALLCLSPLLITLFTLAAYKGRTNYLWEKRFSIY